jgi:hypothetical protein
MIRPIDINLNIQHAAEVVRVGTAESQGRPEIAAQHYADRLEKQARQQQEQVQRKDAADKNSVNPDGKGYGGFNQKRKPGPVKNRDGDKNKKPQPGAEGESRYNILI